MAGSPELITLYIGSAHPRLGFFASPMKSPSVRSVRQAPVIHYWMRAMRQARVTCLSPQPRRKSAPRITIGFQVCGKPFLQTSARIGRGLSKAKPVNYFPR